MLISMRFDIVTIFPEFFAGPLDYGIVRRAREASIASVHVQDLREFTHDRHRTVDDRPFGGGEGMVLKPEPLFDAVESLLGRSAGDAANPAAPEAGTAIVLLSAAGKLFRQETARQFSQLERIVFLCGRYEGVDERVAERLATHEISIGDFVLSGGELAAALILDAVTRLLPGALGNEASALYESFSAPQVVASGQSSNKSEGEIGSAREIKTTRGKKDIAPPSHICLDFPHYTRPADFRGWGVPEILIGGNHEEIRKWRAAAALEKTRRNRPDLI
jgi:tRNA (guanine37-N1)-methyltransferase